MLVTIRNCLILFSLAGDFFVFDSIVGSERGDVEHPLMGSRLMCIFGAGAC
jgi:hypothetical protein